MAFWSPEVIIQQKKVIELTIRRMERCNEELLAGLGTYSTMVQDQVSVSTKQMIIKVDALLKEINEKIDRQIHIMEEGAKGMLDIESNAMSDINSIK